MSILDRFTNRAPMVQPTTGGSSFGRSIFSNSSAITPQNALHLTTIFACNRVLAETISSISLNVYRNVKGGREEATDFYLYPLLKYNPNPNTTSVMWREMIVTDLNTRGNHYSQIVRNGLGQVSALYALHPDRMEPKLAPGAKKIFVYDMGTKRKMVKAHEILHIPGLPSGDGFTGISPIEANRRSIQLGATTQQFGINFFERGANASGAFYKDGVLDQQAYERLKKDLADGYTGMEHSGKAMLLEDGLRFERIMIPNNEAQFLETRKYQKEEIASIYRVPMHLINSLENATFSNIEHQSLEFIQFTILPWLKRIEQALNSSLLTPEEQRQYSIKFNVDTLLRGDFKTRTEGYKTMVNNGLMTINEARRLENLNDIGTDGDKHFFPLNMTTIQKLEKGGDR